MAFTRSQSKTAAGSSATASVTLDSGPAQGDLLVCVIGTSSGTVKPTLPSGFTEVPTDGYVTNAGGQLVCYKIAGASESSTISSTVDDGPWRIIVSQYHDSAGGIWKLDKSQHNSGDQQSGSPIPDTGTTATTTRANEVWVACFETAGGGSIRSLSGPTNSFVLVQGSNVTFSTYMYDKIVSATGTARCQATASGNCSWVGTMATFYSLPISPILRKRRGMTSLSEPGSRAAYT